MKAIINIELQEGETLLQAIDALIPGIGSKSATPCTCSHAEEDMEKPEEERAEAVEAEEEPLEEEPETKPAKTTKTKKSAEKAKKTAPAAGPDFEEVRAAAMKAINAGHRVEVEKILKDNGGNLPDIDKAKYADVLEALEGLI